VDGSFLLAVLVRARVMTALELVRHIEPAWRQTGELHVTKVCARWPGVKTCA
jgi:hypothetical protein